MRSFGKSVAGMQRKNNEDSIYTGSENAPVKNVFIVADGMGGHNAGEVASRMAASLICDDLEGSLSEQDNSLIAKKIAAAIDFANSEIYNMSIKNSAQAGMGTTTIVTFVKEGLVRILKEHHLKFGYADFLKIGTTVAVPSLIAALGTLSLVF